MGERSKGGSGQGMGGQDSSGATDDAYIGSSSYLLYFSPRNRIVTLNGGSFRSTLVHHMQYCHAFHHLTNEPRSFYWEYLILARVKRVYISIQGSIKTGQCIRHSYEQRTSETGPSRCSALTASPQLTGHMPKDLSVMDP